jgi:hypothetical protein
LFAASINSRHYLAGFTRKKPRSPQTSIGVMMRKLLAVCAVFFGFASSIDDAAARAHASTHCLPGDLKRTLNQLESRFGPVQVISTHRPGARVRGTGRRSLHADCRAVDFRPSKGQHAAVVSWLRQNHGGGLGTYSGRHNHIHIDNGGAYTWHNGSRGRSRVARGRGGARVAQSRQSRSATRQVASLGGMFAAEPRRSRNRAERRRGRATQVAGWTGRSAARSSYRQRAAERRQGRRGGSERMQQQAWKLPGFQG